MFQNVLSKVVTAKGFLRSSSEKHDNGVAKMNFTFRHFPSCIFFFSTALGLTMPFLVISKSGFEPQLLQLCQSQADTGLRRLTRLQICPSFYIRQERLVLPCRDIYQDQWYISLKGVTFSKRAVISE